MGVFLLNLPCADKDATIYLIIEKASPFRAGQVGEFDVFTLVLHLSAVGSIAAALTACFQQVARKLLGYEHR